MSSKPIIQRSGKMRLYFFATPTSRGVSSEKTAIDWNVKGEVQPVKAVRIHKVDNSG